MVDAPQRRSVRKSTLSERSDFRKLSEPSAGAASPRLGESRASWWPLLQRIAGDAVLALLAVVLSVILWFIVTNEQNPPVEGLFPYELEVRPVNVKSGLDVFGDIGTVRIRISAPRDVWSRLRVDSFDAKVDLSQSEAGQREVPVRVDVRDSQVTVLEVSPRQLPVWLEPRKERQVPVRVDIRDGPPDGYSYRPPQVSPDMATVSGPASLIDQVESVVAQVSVEGARVNINQQVPLTARSVQGQSISNIRIEPQVVTVDVPIDQQVQYKAVPVHPVVTGEVLEGYWVESIRSDPAIVVVVGTRDALQPLTFVQTTPVEINRAQQSTSVPVGLLLPEGVTVATPQTITVQVTIAPVIGSKTIRVSPEVRNLGPDLTYSAGELSITVQGPSPTLARLTPGDLSVVVDGSNLGLGTHQAPVSVTAPTGVEVLRVVPERVRVEVSTAGAPGG